MNMQEMVRLLAGLRKIGLSDTEITNFLIYIEGGDEQYCPQEKAQQDPPKIKKQ